MPIRVWGTHEAVTGGGQGGFAASDAVGRYWLARCDGFEACSLDGRMSGVVAGVELDYAGRASTLHVDRRHGSPLEIRPSAVAMIDPWERLVVVTLPPHTPRTARAARAVSSAAARSGHAAGTGTAKAGAASVAAVAATRRRAAPPARRFVLWLGVRAAFVLAVAGWLYAVTVFTVARVCARLLLATLAAVTRLGVRAAPPAARATRRAISAAGGQIQRVHHVRGRSWHWPRS